MNHQAVPQVTPAKTHPLTAPKPEDPRTAHVMAPRAAKSKVGRMRSCWKSRAGEWFGSIQVLLPDKSIISPHPVGMQEVCCAGFFLRPEFQFLPPVAVAGEI